MKALIVEDEISIALELELILQELGHEVIGRVDNSTSAYEKIVAEIPDLICMDIDIKGSYNGLDIAEKITHLSIPIIFITSSSDKEIALRIDKLKNAVYIVKPIKKFTLKSVIELILARNEIKRKNVQTYSADEFLFLKKKDNYVKIKLDEILYVRAEGDYSVTHTKTTKFINHLTISKMQEVLPEKDFIKPHRSYLVNIKNIDSISLTNSQISIGDCQIPVSRNNKTAIQEAFKLLK